MPRPAGLPLLALLALLAAVPAHPGTLEVSRIREKIFPSGLRLLVKEEHAAPLAAVQVWVQGGGLYETKETSGTAHVIEHLVFKGTATGEPGSIDEEIESVGGLLSAQTEKDWTQFSCTVAGRYAERVVGVIGEALRKPAFRPKDLDDERSILLEEVQNVQRSVELAIPQQLYAMAYRTHPYQFDVRGTGEFVRGITPDAVRAYYERHYLPANITVVIVGDVDTAGITAAVEKAFDAGKPATAQPAPLPQPELPGSLPQRKVEPVPIPNGILGLAYPAPAIADEAEVAAMDLLLTLLEHQGSGRLPRAVGNGAAVSAGFTTRRHHGLFTVTAVTAPGSVEAIEGRLRREIDFLRANPVPEAELTLAKRILAGTYRMDNEPYSGQASSLGYYAAIGNWRFACEYPAKVQAVTAEQLQEVARKYLVQEKSVAYILRPEGDDRPAPAPDTQCAPAAAAQEGSR